MIYKEKRIRRISRLLGALAGCALMCLTSCVADSPEGPVEAPDAIRIKASMADELATRGVITSGDVKSGTFYIMFTRKSTSQFDIEPVLFDKSVMDSQGYVPSGLQWSLIKNNVFYMDNVPPAINKGSDVENVVFGSDNPFVAGMVVPDVEIEEDYVASNDLLWGTETPPTNANAIAFNLHHAMSKLKVQVTVDNTNAVGDQYDLTNAEVTLSNIITKPATYNRKNGNISLGDKPEYETITLVDMAEGGNGLDWCETRVDSDDPENKVIYTTFDCIVPPQSLDAGEYRPKLTIKVKTKDYPDGKVYSGYLPHSMELVEAGPQAAPMTLSFLREHYLTIRAVISNEPPELILQPVWVYQWVDKGEYTVDGYQAGVYNEDDFMELIGYYDAGNDTQLRRFGKKNANGSWTFNLFGNFELEESTISGSMRPDGVKPPYSFFLDDFFTIYVVRQNGDKLEIKGSAGAKELYKITSGSM